MLQKLKINYFWKIKKTIFKTKKKNKTQKTITRS